MRPRAVLLLAAFGACGVASAGPPTAPSAPSVPAAPRASALERGVGYRLGPLITYRGACDASGAAGVGGGLVAVADDEDNRLRIYDAARGGAPVEVVDTSRHLGTRDEMDLEGAATVGERVYWIASHGRKKSGKRAPSRLVLFASDVQGDHVTHTGRPFVRLLDALGRAPELSRYHLDQAAARSPIAPGGLNIEGLTETPEGHLLLGFRNPVPRGHALLVRITNPADVVERRAAPRFGAPLELALEGRGVRTIASWEGAYWIVGGAVADPTVPSRVYRWDGTGAPVWIDSIDLGDLNVEAIATVTVDRASRLLLFSDDGTRQIGGRACKKLRDDRAKQFRATWLEVSAVR